MDVGQCRYERENSLFSYQNCILATQGKTIVGILVAFPMFADPRAEPEDDPVLAPCSKLEEDNSYYVCGVAVFIDVR